VIGGAAVLAPKYLPRLGRGFGSLFTTPARRPIRKAATAQGRRPRAPEHRDEPNRDAAKSSSFAQALFGKEPLHRQALAPKLGLKQAIAKTITFRIIVTTLDFSTNYLVIGELGTAAGLSAFALVAGPLFYFAHEALWNYYGPPGGIVDLSALRRESDAEAQPATGRGIKISRALAKTITFRTVATAMDFTATFVVVGDLATAAGLSAFGFVVGPFVYLGHEMIWDRYTSPRKDAPTLALPAPPRQLPAPA
jgi:uncharacterized membrane protein